MPIAAVPSYLGSDFRNASPGMRFGMYLMLWGINHRSKRVLWETHDIDYETRGPNRQEREVQKENKLSALTDATRLNDNDKRIMRGLFERQRQAFAECISKERGTQVERAAVAPFTTGLGNEHPLENGFSFLIPYGLPYLPGSGVKGVLRQAARELAAGQWGEKHGWNGQQPYRVRVGKDTVTLSMLDVLFGRESGDGDTQHLRGVLRFWDVIPQIKGDSLIAEIMTPHQKHYYQDGESPHESGSPNPIAFLTVPPGSRFTFYVTCDRERLERIAPDLSLHDLWKELLDSAFEHAFTWLGFGAKTAVGYGAMQIDKEERAKRISRAQEVEAEKARQREIEAATSGLPPDAAWLVQKVLSNAWPDTDAFLKDVKEYLDHCESLSQQAYQKFDEEMNRRWNGIMSDPDKLEGKKQKPKFKDRPKAIAKRLLQLKSD